ncbi:MAG TPA: BatD family protein [Gemmatimonadaceae bacterium]|nr:BatD family protein [Gemmatimonadaceae bacterium]
MIGLLIAAQLAVTVRAPDTVIVGSPTVVVVSATAAGVALPRVSAPQGDAFRLTLVGEASQVSVVGATRSTKIEQQFQLVARRAGFFTLPPFEVTGHGTIARSSPRRIVARVGTANTAVPLVISRARLGEEEGVALRAVAAPDTVYVGQQVTYQVGVFLDDDVRVRLRRNPEFIPPEPRGMLAYELPAPPPRTAYGKGGARYEAHVFQRALFPLNAGRYVVPQAQLVYALPLSSSFFSREESRTARADSVLVVAVEPPAAGRPTDYAGAVGELSADVRVDSTAAREGDPLVVTVSVSGRGNVKLLPRPALAVPWGTVVPGDERVRVDTASVAVRGVKEFDWIVTPRAAGTLSLPAVRYPFFNPYTERYEIAVTPPRSIDVAPGTLASIDSAPARVDSAPLMPLRPTLRAPVDAPVEGHPVFWAVALLAPLPAAAAAVARRPRRAPRAVAPADALRALATGRGTSDAAQVRRAYVGALADRLALSPGALASSSGALAQALARAGVTVEGARAAESLLASLDGAAYAPGGRAPAGVARAAATAFDRVDREALPRLALAARAAARLATRASGSHPWVPVLVLLLAGAATLGAGVLRAAVDDEPSRAFSAGMAQYHARHFADAARLFDSAAEQLPRAADAWANFGTASWAAHDTAAAAVGWQRAMRLEPLAADVRDRLALVGAPEEGGIASVPRLPRAAAPLAALATWATGWALICAGVLRRRRGAAGARRPGVGAQLAPWGAAAVTLSLALAVGAREVTSRFDARGLAVVVDRGPLRALPALAADAGPGLYPGDVARVGRRDGAWAHVELDAGREGWVEWSRLVPLALPHSAAEGGREQ